MDIIFSLLFDKETEREREARRLSEKGGGVSLFPASALCSRGRRSGLESRGTQWTVMHSFI